MHRNTIRTDKTTTVQTRESATFVVPPCTVIRKQKMEGCPLKEPTEQYSEANDGSFDQKRARVSRQV